LTTINDQLHISLTDISFEYKENQHILKNISFNIYKNKILGIVGPNGGGKSTLLKIIAGLLPPNSGKIKLNESLVTGPLHERINLAYVSQSDDSLCTLPLKVKDIIKLGQRNQSSNKGIQEILNLFALEEITDQLYFELSGGQKQRVLLAKALAQNPELLILDEPTKGLDSLGQDQLLSLMNKIIKENPHTSIVIVDHNLNQVIKHSDSILCLNRTHHWHDKKELLDQDIINSVYHCEFEHTLIHESNKDEHLPEHHHCDHDHDHHHQAHQHDIKKSDKEIK
jgi:zinc transport system ATP-binding protein